MTIGDLRPPEDVPVLISHLNRTGRTGPRTKVWRHRMKEGRIIFVEITTHSMVFAGCALELTLAVDVTARIAAEEENRRKNREL